MENKGKVIKLLLIILLFVSCGEKKHAYEIVKSENEEGVKNESNVVPKKEVHEEVKVEIVNSNDWRIEKLDDKDRAGIHNSIAVDSKNKVHISYYDAGLKILAYATNRSGEWKEYKVKGTDNHGEFNSIAVDSNDAIHISYLEYDNKNLRYVTIENSKTSKEIIDSGDWIGFSTSIALDKNDNVYIAYLDKTGTDILKYATKKNGKWKKYEIYKARLGVANASLSIDRKGEIHISFIADSDLFYATNKSGRWDRKKVSRASANLKNVGVTSKIKSDSKGNVHIVMGLAGLEYFTNESGKGERYEIFKQKYGLCEEADIAIDSNDKLHIAFRILVMSKEDWKIDVSNDVYYATNKNGKWEISKVESIGTLEIGLSIAVDSDGFVHMCYNTLDKHFEGEFHYATNRPVSIAKLVDNTLVKDNQVLLSKW